MLRLLEPREINQVLNLNFKIWSPGLDRESYRYYQWWQLNHPWGRRHTEYFGYFADGRLVASCKRYKLRQQSRGRIFEIAGIGAVFVSEENRGHSFGMTMLELIADLSESEGYDAMMLNSDIDPDYYARLGYHLFEAMSFSIILTDNWLEEAIKSLDLACDHKLDQTFAVRCIAEPDFEEMCRHHTRWLAVQQHGLQRSVDYWQYKVGRELYLFEHSSLNWPRLEIITDNYEKFIGGYALIEQSHQAMRVLEVIGQERVRISLLSQILRLAQKRRIKILRGWKSVCPPLKRLTFYNRDWSFPMICPLKEELEAEMISWTESKTPPILELDHF